MQLLLMLGVIGHILCGISDCVFHYWLPGSVCVCVGYVYFAANTPYYMLLVRMVLCAAGTYQRSTGQCMGVLTVYGIYDVHWIHSNARFFCRFSGGCGYRTDGSAKMGGDL